MSNLTKKQEFILFCMEAYKNKYKLSGKDVFDLFKDYNIFTFLNNGYEVLHTQSMDYIVSEIYQTINNKK